MRTIDREFFATAPILGGLPDDAVRMLADVARVVDMAAGAVLFTEGEPAHCMYIVHSGRLEILKRRVPGADVRLSMLERGDCIGEMSLIEIQPRSATVRALEPASLYALDHGQIAQLYRSSLEVYTLLVLNLARELSRRLRHADERLLALRLETETARDRARA